MKLLLLTQKIDRDDPVLGFFHRWVEALSSRVDSVSVVALGVGSYDLPTNVHIHSLGKEKGANRFQVLREFYRSIRAFREDYDVVLVHMNEEYVLLGGLLWRLWGKKVFLWRNHYKGSFRTTVAAMFCNKVFSTSKFSYTAQYRNSVLMPVGIDTEFFKPNPSAVRKKNAVLFLGRMAPSKRPEVFLQALSILGERRIPFSASLYGDPSPIDFPYYESLKEKARSATLLSSVSFYAATPNHSTPAIYNAHELFVNCSPSGMLDKTIFEAAACGSIPLVSSKDIALSLGKEFFFPEGKKEVLADKLQELLALPEEGKGKLREKLRAFVVTRHSLDALIRKLVEEMQV